MFQNFSWYIVSTFLILGIRRITLQSWTQMQILGIRVPWDDIWKSEFASQPKLSKPTFRVGILGIVLYFEPPLIYPPPPPLRVSLPCIMHNFVRIVFWYCIFFQNPMPVLSGSYSAVPSIVLWEIEARAIKIRVVHWAESYPPRSQVYLLFGQKTQHFPMQEHNFLSSFAIKSCKREVFKQKYITPTIISCTIVHP